MLEGMELERSIRSLVGKFDKKEIYDKKPYAFISYSHAMEDVKKIYPFLQKLLTAGYSVVLDTEYAEMNDSWVNGMTRRVYHENCKLMISFISSSYMYSRPSLIEQYCRYSQKSKAKHDGEVVSCLVVDVSEFDNLDYIKLPNEQMIGNIEKKNPKDRYTLGDNSESAECLRDGLDGFYESDNEIAMARRIINREYEALQKYENIDEIRRQMRFVLQAGKHLDGVCNIRQEDTFQRVAGKLETLGLKADEEVKKIADEHFKEWGKEYYEYKENGQAKMKYVPRRKMFELISNKNGDKPEQRIESQDITEITKAAGLDENKTNLEQYWINTEDGKSLREKHGYFSDCELTPEQENIRSRVVEKIKKIMTAGPLPDKAMGDIIIVQGEAGTGKTVLAQRIFTDIKKEYPDGNYYFVVNHKELLNDYKHEMRTYQVSERQINGPAEVLNDINKSREEGKCRPDIIFVDEAHLLLTQGAQQYTGKNKKYIVGDNMVADMKRNARLLVLMFDENQILRSQQCWEDGQFEQFLDEAIEAGNYGLLKRQMRIAASQDVMDWISSFVGGEHRILPIPRDIEYDFRIFDSVSDMHELIRQLAGEEEYRKSRMVATYDWEYHSAHGYDPKGKNSEGKNPWMVSVDEENWSMPWNNEMGVRTAYYHEKYKMNKELAWIDQDYSVEEVGSTFSVQGFDLPYVGVILGPSVSYDKENQQVKIIPENCKDKQAVKSKTLQDGTKKKFTETLVWNAVNVLLTRGRKGLFIYAVDKDLREALLKAAGQLV